MTKKSTHTKKGLRPPKKHSAKAHAKVYWPYLPLMVLLIGATFINIWQPLQSHRPATLAYATETSRNALLSSTNSRRASHGAAALALNSQLNAAAQAKANDMVARDYWSHNTPDGQEPWVFIDAQGYQYSKAGENLAYGFDTSDQTIIGWMNSPSHRDNMLDTAYKEVGFGFSNSANFVGSGEQTIVVAMYGSTLAATTPPPAPQPAPTPPPAETQQQTQQASTPPPAEPQQSQQPEQEQPEETQTPLTEQKDEAKQSADLPVTTDTPVPEEQESQRITRAQELTNGSFPWIAGAISGFGIAISVIWLMKHAVLVKRFIVEGEHFIAHHPILDMIVIALIAAAVYLSQSSGVVI